MMAQLNHTKTYGSNVTPTIEQLLREGDASSLSSTHSTLGLGKDHDPEEDIDHHQKKSVFFKVKEKAKKLRYSLSNKKKHGEDENTTPSWGYNLDEDEDEDEDTNDAEYLGAPMYESELAPEYCKENARQHPRANPVIAENHILANLASKRDEKVVVESSLDNVKTNDLPSLDNVKTNYLPSLENVETNFETAPANSTITKIQEKESANPSSPSKTLTETVTEKLAPVYSTVTDATQALASKIQNLTVSAPSNSSAYSSPATPNKASTPTPQKTSSSPTTPQASKLGKGIEQIWDKGVSVKEYLLHKFEPGEDERALSQVLSDTLSPRKMSRDVGMVEKVKDAVNSMLRDEEAPQTKATQLAAIKVEGTPQPVAVHSATKSSSRLESSPRPVDAKSTLRAEATPQPVAAHLKSSTHVENSPKPMAAKSSLRAEAKPQPMTEHLSANSSSWAEEAPLALRAVRLSTKPSSQAMTAQQTTISQPMVAHLAGKSSSSAPVFTTTHTVAEEENLERILQAN